MLAEEQLVAITAMEKLTKKKKGEIREECEERFFEQYEDFGIKKKELRLAGQSMGEFIMVMKPSTYEVTDAEEFNDFALSNGLASVKRTINPWMIEKVISILEDQLTEEELAEYIKDEVEYNKGWEKFMNLVDGVVVLDGTNHVVPGVSYVPEHPKNTMVKGCEPEVVFPAIMRLGGVERLLLGDADG